MKKFLLLVLCGGLTTSLVFADNNLWVDGKDRPNERVNVDLRSLSPDAFLRVAERVDEAVVNISTTTVIKVPRGFQSPRRQPFQSPRNRDNDQRRQPFSPFDQFFGDDLFEHFFGGPQAPPTEQRQQSLGSGFLLNSDGYIVTNNHVVDRAEEIKVVLSDSSEHKAKVIGRDPKTDVALIKIEPKKKLTAVALGDSDRLKVGEIVVAIGNPFGLSHSVTQGIVSAKERSIGFGNYDDFIQTDASINPGNSGGPLLNLQGEVIGINTAIFASAQGIGFAIPINLAKKVLFKLKNEGKVVRGWLGVMIQPVSEESAKFLKLPRKSGALVADVQADSPAKKAGLQVGDVIMKFDGKPVNESSELPVLVADTAVKKKTTVEIIRDGSIRTIEIEVGELKDTDVADATEEEPDGKDLLGVSVQTITPDVARSLGLEKDQEGVVVSDIDQAGAAYAKGVRQGDVIIELNRKSVNSVKKYRELVTELKKGDTVLLLVKRGQGTLFVAFTL